VQQKITDFGKCPPRRLILKIRALCHAVCEVHSRRKCFHGLGSSDIFCICIGQNLRSNLPLVAEAHTLLTLLPIFVWLSSRNICQSDIRPYPCSAFDVQAFTLNASCMQLSSTFYSISIVTFTRHVSQRATSCSSVDRPHAGFRLITHVISCTGWSNWFGKPLFNSTIHQDY
jgi:hypothetical protein